MRAPWLNLLCIWLLLQTGQLLAGVRGCDTVPDDYSPYGQWGDLPAMRDGLVDYVPLNHWPDYADPRVVNETTEATDISIILMHGKNGSPWFENQVILVDQLAALGFKVISPTMPWGRKFYYTLDQQSNTWVQHQYFAWDADLCGAMHYIARLVAAERALGRRVILMGHSMGGRHALLYGYLNTEDDIIAIITSAPGGLVPLATTLMNETAASRQKAKNLVAAGNGDLIDTFDTYNTGGIQEIITTAHNYLTYHEPDPDAIPDPIYTPDVRDMLPNIAEPVLWLVGADDSLKGFYERNGLFAMLPQNPLNSYRVLQGDHLSVMLNESGPIHDWFSSWSSINPADRDGDGSPDKSDAFPDEPAASVDTDADGLPDAWHPDCDQTCQQNANLILDADDDGDGMTDSYETANGLNPVVDDAALDKDSDGHSNLAEFQAGTAANDPNDYPKHTQMILTILPLILE